MPYQNISASLSAEDVKAIKDALATIAGKMPFLILLTAEERKTLLKKGPRSLDFVRKCREVSQSHPGILPADFNAAEFNRDVELASTLSEVNRLLVELCEKVDDTLMAVGSEAMRSSLDVYDYVKSAARRKPGMKSVETELSERFKGQKNRKTAATPPVTPKP